MSLRKRLSELRSFQSVLGHFSIQGDRLIAETNSKERAVKLRRILGLEKKSTE